MAFQEINPTIWTPVEPEDSVEGIFIKAELNVGPQKSTLYHLEVEQKPVSIWGCMILDQRMVSVKAGDKTRITFKGLAEKQPGKNAAKIFKVEVDRE